jgi:6-phosphogluconate dehydrogenase
MKVAIIGLGRMGSQMAQKLVTAGHQVAAHNRSQSPMDAAVAYGAIAAPTKQAVVDFFDGEVAIVWLMLPSTVVNDELKAWLKLLPAGSILIDGGNSDFRHTKQRADDVMAAGMNLLDCGTSGGIWGQENGFSLMVGGDKNSFRKVEPLFKALSVPHGGYAYFGESGSGHYVKMVHNAIEYGMMESLAEGYRLLHEGPYRDLNLAAAGEVWQKSSVVRSWLNELSQQALAKNPDLEGIDGYVAETGEARWALEVANAHNVPLPAIQAAMQVRLDSQAGKTNFATKLLAAMRHAFGGHLVNKQ